MGKFKVVFLYNGINIEQLPIDTIFGKHPQKFQLKFNTDKMSQIDFEGDDYELNFDIDNLSMDMDWSSLNYPNDVVKGKVLEIIYYKSIQDRLTELIGEIRNCRYEDKYKLESYGINAKSIISNIKDSIYLKGLFINKVEGVNAISHTIFQEVGRLIRYSKDKDSQKSKNKALFDAIRHLVDDIQSIVTHLEYYDVNK